MKEKEKILQKWKRNVVQVNAYEILEFDDLSHMLIHICLWFIMIRIYQKKKKLLEFTPNNS